MENIRDYIFDSKIASDKVEIICRKALTEMYGENLPKLISNRLDRELQIITENQYADKYLLAMGIADKNRELGYMHILGGSGGSSFVAYLMKISNTNPLPPHYYCPVCKRVEFVDESRCYTGYDLIRDRKVCTVCKNVMTGDGHNIPYENFLGLDGEKEPYFQFNVAHRIKTNIEKYLQTIFGENKVFYGCYKNTHSKTNSQTLNRKPGSIFICPPNINIYDVAEVNNDGYIPTIVSDCNELSNRFPLKEIKVLCRDQMVQIKELEKETGVKAKEVDISEVDIQSFFKNISIRFLNTFPNPEFFLSVVFKIKPKTFGEALKLYGFLHGTQVWVDNGEILFDEGHPIDEIITFREDVMNYLLQHGMDRKTAYSIMEKARMKKCEVLLTADDEEIMRAYNIPEWYIDSIKKLVYLFPKAYAVESGILNLILLWYKEKYPKEFEDVTGQPEIVL